MRLSYSTRHFLVLLNNIKFIAFILFILSIYSCKKDEPESQVTYRYINDELKTNYSFNQGSYWVYENQDMEIDSVVLAHRQTGFTSVCPQNDCPRYEFIELTFSSLSRKVTFNHYLMLNYIRYNGGGNWGEHGQPIHMMNSNKGDQFNGLVVGEVFDSLLVANTMFYQVEKMTVQTDQQFQKEFDYDRDFYFTPSIGIVRTVIHNPHGAITWDLKRYHIE